MIETTSSRKTNNDNMVGIGGKERRWYKEKDYGNDSRKGIRTEQLTFDLAIPKALTARTVLMA